MKGRVRVDGLKELNKALSGLSKGAAKGTLRRVLIKAAAPIAEAAKANAPVDSGALRDSIVISAKLRNPVGNAEFAAAMRAGEGKEAAVAAMRDARRAASGSFAQIWVGSSMGRAALVEFGTHPHVIKPRLKSGLEHLSFVAEGARVTPTIVNHPGSGPKPFMRPAFEAKKAEALTIMASSMKDEISNAVARQTRRAALKASRGL